MTTIMISRTYVADNREDLLRLGNHEHEGNTTVSEYLLPDGYSVNDDRIYDPAGIECAIVLHAPNGGPVLMSRMGGCPDHPLLRA
jgi:hypothetical protein